MPKDKLTDYSATNASNTDVGGVNTDEGMLPSAVNNAIREVMTHLKNFAAGTDGIDVLSLADDTATNAIKLQAPSSVTTTTTLTLPDGDGTDGQVLSTDGSGALSFVNTTPAPSLIINGDMAVSQRGTSETGITTPRYAQAPDRFAANINIGTWTASQSTTVPSGQGFSNSYKYECTTANASPAASGYLILDTRIEAQNLQHLAYGTSSAKSVTVSFWVRSNKTGTTTLEMYQADAAKYITGNYTINAADTWEYKEITFIGNTADVINNDNGQGLILSWWLGSGSDYNGGTQSTGSWKTTTNERASTYNLADTVGNTFYLTGVKMEVGSATPFLHESYGENLAKCQRYYFEPDNNSNNRYAYWRGDVTNGNVYSIGVEFPVSMRALPTITVLDGLRSGFSAGVTANAETNSSCRLNGTSNVTQAARYFFQAVQADAEL